jgi:hypothetical protein
MAKMLLAESTDDCRASRIPPRIGVHSNREFHDDHNDVGQQNAARPGVPRTIFPERLLRWAWCKLERVESKV